jgi:TRAP-type C4-dicarboxylate transport system substrate-binding protein
MRWYPFSLIISETRWNRLTEDQKKAILDAESEASAFAYEAFGKYDQSVLDALSNKAFSINEIDTSAISRETLNAVYGNVLKTDEQKHILEIILSHWNSGGEI